jgi:hypothetical protein
MSTKVTFSAEEQQLMQNSSWILTKNLIIEKVQLLFGELLENVKPIVASCTIAEIIKPNPKIFKGEAYQQLPWVMLDYPRLFTNTDTFAIRNFFWWANFYSTTLQVSGIYRQLVTKPLLQQLANNTETYICINENAWQHHFGPDNYELLTPQKINDFTQNNYTTIKLAQKYNLQNAQQAQQNMLQFYTVVFNCLTGEKAL